MISDEVNDQQCISSIDCDEGSICNFDNEKSGFCESCEGLNSDQDCDEKGFITAEGKRECKSGCVTNVTYIPNKDLSEYEHSAKTVVDQSYSGNDDSSESDHSAIFEWFLDFVAVYHQIILLCICVFVSMIMANIFARCLIKMERSNYNVSFTFSMNIRMCYSL